jgi:hypothetical protein
MKKLISVLLALAIVLSLAPAAFAEDVTTITMSADKESVAPGETVTLTLRLEQDMVADAVGFGIYFDTNAYTLTNRKNLGNRGIYRLGFTDYDPANERGDVRAAYLQTTFDNQDPFHTTWTAGDWASYTFTAKEGANTSDAKFTLHIDNLLNYSEDGSEQIKVDYNVVGGELTVPVVAPVVKGYTVSMGDDKQAAFGQTVEIPVTIGYSDESVTTFNAYDMTFAYDSSALKLDMEAADDEGYRVIPGDGTVRIARYGQAADLGEALTLKFEVLAGQGSSNVTVTSAKVDTNGNAIEFDAPDAQILRSAATVTVSGYTVDLPDDFTRTDAEGSTIEAGSNLTFKPKDPNYDYNVTVTVGGEAVTPAIGEDGTYTVPNVNGNVTVTSTKTPKSFSVTLGDDTTGEATATYTKDYIFTLTPASGYTYNVTVTIGGKTYTNYTPVVNENGTTTYTIPGADVTGDIVINSNKAVKPAQTFSVSFTGTGASDAKGASSVTENAAYTFTVDKKDNFEYTVSATMGGKTVAVTEGENGSYTIAKVTGNLVITVEKKSVSTMNVAVSKFVEMDNKTVFLVTVTGTPEDGKAFAYDENVMYKTPAYGENVYSWLVIVDSTADLTAADAETKITQAAATAEEVAAGYDVNETSVVDINDAQLTYDIYSGKYTDFEKVSVRKFLRADTTSDKVVNAADAVAVVANSK